MNAHRRLSLSLFLAAFTTSAYLVPAQAEPIYYATLGRALPTVTVDVSDPISIPAEIFSYYGPAIGEVPESGQLDSPTGKSATFTFLLPSLTGAGLYEFSAEQANATFAFSFYALFSVPSLAGPVSPGAGVTSTITGTSQQPVTVPTAGASTQVQVSVDGGPEVTTALIGSGISLFGLVPGGHTVTITQDGNVSLYSVDIADLPEPISLAMLATSVAAAGIADGIRRTQFRRTPKPHTP